MGFTILMLKEPTLITQEKRKNRMISKKEILIILMVVFVHDEAKASGIDLLRFPDEETGHPKKRWLARARRQFQNQTAAMEKIEESQLVLPVLPSVDTYPQKKRKTLAEMCPEPEKRSIKVLSLEEVIESEKRNAEFLKEEIDRIKKKTREKNESKRRALRLKKANLENRKKPPKPSLY